MTGTFTSEGPKQDALCRVCFEPILKNDEAILFTTCHANKFARLSIHPRCFPEKSTITP
jgi:hypothetical protein